LCLRNIWKFLSATNELLDTPTKQSLWFFLHKMLDSDHQDYVKNETGDSMKLRLGNDDQFGIRSENMNQRPSTRIKQFLFSISVVNLSFFIKRFKKNEEFY
jgi:hypothetical protein